MPMAGPGPKPAGLVRLALTLLVGSLLLQTAWIVSVPPFAAHDEFDHAYRALSVARGHWDSTGQQAVHGRGDLVVVPRTLVDAVSSLCDTYRYTGHDNCHPVSDVGDGMVTVASAAARYEPVFYALIGMPAAWFSGASSLYAMRTVAALMCAAFISLAGVCLARWSRTGWPFFAAVVAFTPVLAYSTMVAAPNGLEMAAGLALWCALLGLTGPLDSATDERRLLWAAVLPAAVLGGVRQLGPLWLLLTLSAVAMLAGASRVKALLRRHRAPAFTLLAVSAVCVAANVAWIRHARSTAIAANPQSGSPVAEAMVDSVLWVFQSIAAFPVYPATALPAPLPIYLGYLTLAAILIVLGLRNAVPRLRWTIGTVLAITLLLPFTLTVLTYEEDGAFWQGRYLLPYSVGAFLLLGVALDRSKSAPRLTPAFLAPALCFVLVAQTVSVWHVWANQRRYSPLSGDPSWPIPPGWVVILLATVGICLLVSGPVVYHRRKPLDVAPEPGPGLPSRR